MLIFARILLLLACGPLLVPPGLCVCHAAIFDHDHDHDDAPADDHPGCPAANASKHAEAAPSFAYLWLPAAVEVALAPPAAVRPPAVLPPVAPFYLSHCTLVI